MNKVPILMNIKTQLSAELENATHAAEQARLAATDDQSVAETQYDTLAIEASFLAHGQSQRAEQLIQAIAIIEKLMLQNECHRYIKAGSLVVLSNEQHKTQYFFIAPVGGGMTCVEGGNTIKVITPSSPLGEAMLGKEIDDDVQLKLGHKDMEYVIDELY